MATAMQATKMAVQAPCREMALIAVESPTMADPTKFSKNVMKIVDEESSSIAVR